MVRRAPQNVSLGDAMEGSGYSSGGGKEGEGGREDNFGCKSMHVGEGERGGRIWRRKGEGRGRGGQGGRK